MRCFAARCGCAIVSADKLKKRDIMPKKKIPLQESPERNALNELENFIDAQLAEEGISPDVLAAVDLEIAFSPVIAIRGESIAQAVEVVPTQGGGYIVRHPLVKYAVDADTLKIMRARFLLARGCEFQPALQRFRRGAR